MKGNAFQLPVIGLALSLLLGCGVISPTVKKEALPPIGMKVLINEVVKYKGETVIMGGYVISVENKADHSRILAVQAPVGIGQRPKSKDLSQGRLVLVYKGYIDPEVYTKDRQITVGGKVLGSSVEQQSTYPYLELEVQELHLWPIEKPSSYPYWYEDDPFYHPWWWYPYRHRHY